MNRNNQSLRDYQTLMDEYRREQAEFNRQRRSILWLLAFCAFGWTVAFYWLVMS